MSQYDYVVVGGGPCGLAFAQVCARYKKRVLILEREQAIGGCHRVRRMNGYFTEHGPRFYSTSYVTFRSLLEDMDLDFHNLFKRFDVNFVSLYDLIRNMTLRNILAFVPPFVQTMWNPNVGRYTSVLQFLRKKKFKAAAIDDVDRICRFTDGGGADNYTLMEFLALVNQQTFYAFYQPRFPNDRGLFPVWTQKLQDTGYVDIQLNADVDHLEGNETGVSYVVTTNGNAYLGKNVVLAVPPWSVYSILSRSDRGLQDAFLPIERLRQYCKNTEYLQYITVIYHWDSHIPIKKPKTFTKTDWNVVFIILSNYMDFGDGHFKTVISAAATRPNVESRVTGLTAQQSSESGVIEEIFRQIRQTAPKLPKYDRAILDPGIRRTDRGMWQTIDYSFITSPKEEFLAANGRVPNLFALGTYNGNHLYNPTSMESAVSNALALCHKLIPPSVSSYPVKRGWYVTDVLAGFTIAIGLLVLFGVYRIATRPNNGDERSRR